MNKIDLFRVLRPIVMRVTGVPECIMADPNAQAPTGSYCAIRTHSHVRKWSEGVQVHKVTDRRTIETTIRQQLVDEATIEFYRDGAIDYAQKLFDARSLPSVTDDLMRHKVGVSEVQPVQNLTTLFNGKQEERASIAFTLFYEHLIHDEVNTIEQVGVVIEDEKERVLAEFDTKV